MSKRFVLLVLDGVGAGELPDAAAFGDAGANTLGNLARQQGGLSLPHLQQLGLGNILEIEGVPPSPAPAASWGLMAEKSQGKDSTLGHWELMGLVTPAALPTYPQGFPVELVETWLRACGLSGALGNRAASGTEIIAELGAEHLAGGKPILYTSADSVFQVAAHEEAFGLERLYGICRAARELLQGEHAVARVIARPFLGAPGSFARTPNRRDFSLPPWAPTAIDAAAAAGVEVVSIGKIRDLFAGVGIERALPSKSNMEGLDRLEALLDAGAPVGRGQLILLNLVDFDMLWGHRLDPAGFRGGLEALDRRLPELLRRLGKRDLLVVTADHGNDPTSGSTDHSREHVPLLAYQAGLPGRPLGRRATFADVGATLRQWFGLPAAEVGVSFLSATAALAKDL
jgi:phosphopentomutase